MKKQIELLPMNIFEDVRRNHAAEHGTLNILAAQGYPHLSGYSDASGFWVMGEVPTDKLQEAITTALTRLRGGESGLAIHPHCGTNYLVSGAAAALAAWLALLGVGRGVKSKLDRFPLAATLAAGAIIASQPLGPWLQEHVTTLADIGDLKCAEITFYPEAFLPLHRVKTRSK